MSFKLIQSTFLIIGTALGAGILALPTSTVACQFGGSVIALTVIWVFMTFSACNMINARLCFSEEVDLSSMTTQLLGKYSNIIVKFCYLALLMALCSTYITVGSTWVIELVNRYTGFSVHPLLAQISFILAITSVIYSGLGNLANINQLITMAKLFCLIMIIVISVPDIETVKLQTYSLKAIPATCSMLLTTFSFSIILPSLTSFLHNDRKKLHIALAIGSVTILVIYLAWELISFGIIGAGENGLAKIAISQDKGTGVINALTSLVQNPSFTTYGVGIMLTAVLTSFLGIGQCLYSYLKDMLPIENPTRRSQAAILFGFFPPLIIINLYPSGISSVLSFAGIFVAIILGLLPNAMILSKKYNSLNTSLSSAHKMMAKLSLVFFTSIILIECYKMIGA